MWFTQGRSKKQRKRLFLLEVTYKVLARLVREGLPPYWGIDEDLKRWHLKGLGLIGKLGIQGHICRGDKNAQRIKGTRAASIEVIVVYQLAENLKTAGSL